MAHLQKIAECKYVSKCKERVRQGVVHCRKNSASGMGAPEKQSGMEIRNQSAMSEKKAPSGMAPLLPVCTSNTFSPLIAASVIPGKYAAQRQATPVQPSYERWIMPQSHTLPKPAPTASSRYTTSSAVSSAPREAGDRNPAQDDLSGQRPEKALQTSSQSNTLPYRMQGIQAASVTGCQRCM